MCGLLSKELKSRTQPKTTFHYYFRFFGVEGEQRGDRKGMFQDFYYIFCDRCIMEEMAYIKQKLGQTLFPAPLHDA